MGPPLKAAENISASADVPAREGASMGPPLKAAENGTTANGRGTCSKRFNGAAAKSSGKCGLA